MKPVPPPSLYMSSRAARPTPVTRGLVLREERGVEASRTPWKGVKKWLWATGSPEIRLPEAAVCLGAWLFRDKEILQWETSSACRHQALTALWGSERSHTLIH